MVDLRQQRTNRQTSNRLRGTGGQNVSRNRNPQSETIASQPEVINLDLFSTSQTKFDRARGDKSGFAKRIYDACLNNAPYFGYQISAKTWGIVQGCCNDWNCPRCGQQRAREEYGRIVAGAREVAKNNTLYMLTITCRGKEMSSHEAENGYLEWTNRLLTRLRASIKRSGREWYYASVTERQTREHPHSHFLTTFTPSDATPIAKGERKYYFTSGESFPAKHNTLQSENLERACVDCGLGRQYDISRLEGVEGAARYVAKYLFKASVFETVWPKGWRRVRYSQNWPKLPDVKSDAMLLLSNDDWEQLARVALIIKTKDDGAKAMATEKLRHADVIIQ